MKHRLSPEFVAFLLNRTTRQLRQWRYDGVGPKCEISDSGPVYPLTDLVPWLRKHRPRLKISPEMLKDYRAAVKAERDGEEERKFWDDFMAETAEHTKRYAAYQLACEFDRKGQFSKADSVLRAAGLSAETIRQRREYINHMIENGGTL